MKNTLLALAALLSLIPWTTSAQIADEIRVQQRDPTNTVYIMRTFGARPAGGNTGVLTIDGLTGLPQYYTTGSGLSADTLTKTITVIGKEPSITAGTSGQYWRGDKTWATFPTNVSSFTNDASYVSSSGLTSILANYAQLSQLSAGLATKFDTPTGTTAQYIRGDGSLATLPAPGTGTVTSVGMVSTDLVVSGSPVTTSGNITANLSNTGISAGTYSSVTVDAKGRATAGFVRSFNNAPARGLVSVAGAANGFQVSSTRDALVSYSVSIATTVSLAGNASGYVVLEIASTNSSTAGDWKEISRVTSGQSGTLLVGLVISQTGGGPLSGMVPAGWYARQRTVNVAGTPVYTVTGQQEVLQ